jgi:hypothetical protein
VDGTVQRLSEQRTARSIPKTNGTRDEVLLTASIVNTIVRKAFESVLKVHPFCAWSSQWDGPDALLVGYSAGSAQDGLAHIRMVQVFETDQTGLSNPAGLAFSPGTNTFQVVESPGQGPTLSSETGVIRLSALRGKGRFVPHPRAGR